jgi:hypothetical protein
MFGTMWEVLRKLLIDRLWPLARRLWHALRVRAFYAFGKDRASGLALAPADIAYSVVGGRVLDAIAFRDLGNEHTLVAVARGDERRGMTYRVVLLEEFGQVYRRTWESPELWGWQNVTGYFGLHDFDKDGHHELSFASLSLGSGAGSASLYLFVPTVPALYELNVDFDWQDHLKPPMPIVSLRPESNDAATRRFHRVIEKLARESGFLNSVRMPDLDDPRNASVRWHKDNGDLKSGSPTIHYYDGPPAVAGSTTAVLDEEDVRSTAYFKGPVVAHLKKPDKHFVVYCPSYIYHWPASVHRAGRKIVIGTEGDGLLRYDAEKQRLDRIVIRDRDKIIEKIETLEREGDTYLVDGCVRVPAAYLED